MCGGGPPYLPYRLAAWLYALPYLFVCLPSWWAVAAYLAAVLGKRTGHGGGLDLGRWAGPRETEKLEYLIVWLRGRIPEYWYDVLIMAITGLSVSLVAGIVTGNIWIALSGLLKAPAYMIGWAVYPNGHGKGIPHLNEATAIGEFLTGFFCVGALVFIHCF